VTFAAHTECGASELQGLRVQDVTLSDLPGTLALCEFAALAPRRAQVDVCTPKSHASTNRVIPLAPGWPMT